MEPARPVAHAEGAAAGFDSAIANIVLHNRAGGGADNLKMTYDAVSTKALAAVVGKSPAGKWTLLVEDKARLDVGKIRGLTLEMGF